MASYNEVVITSDFSGQFWNCCMWDLATGSTLRTFKNSSSVSGTVCVIGQDYLISAEPNKPLIHVWELHSKEGHHQHIVAPGRVLALTVTSDGAYCIGAVAEQILIWQICSGELLVKLSRHYQPITCLKCSDYGSCIVSSGEDGLVFVWDLGRILNSVMHSTESDDGLLYTWSHHSLAVTSVHMGKGGRRSRVATASLDQTCRLYSLASGELLLTVLFDISITAVTMDNAEYFIFCGSTDGRIFTVNLFEPPSTSEHHFAKEKDKSHTFIGHNKAVLGMSVSVDGRTLVSGSQDATAKIWNVASRQCIRTLNHKGSVTNILILPKYDSLNTRKPKTIQLPRSWKQTICGSDSLDGAWKHTIVSQVNPTPKNEFPSIFNSAHKLLTETSKTDHNLKEEIEELRNQNSVLYKLAVEKITKD